MPNRRSLDALIIHAADLDLANAPRTHAAQVQASSVRSAGTAIRRRRASNELSIPTAAKDRTSVAFWNVEWYTPCYKEKVDALAEVIVDLNFDVWALGETTVDAVRLLVERLHRDYDLDFGCGFAEPDAPAGTLQIGVLWNLTSAVCETVAWPAELDEWFRVETEQFDGLRDEAVHGRIFERYPGLFRCRSTNRQPDADPFAFVLMPLQLPPARERSARTHMAAKILAAAVQRMQTAGESDWIVGGDYAAEQATQEFRGILRSSLVTLSAGEEGDSSIGAISYLKSPNSLIDNIFLSRNLGRTFGADDFFIVAADRAIPDYIGASRSARR